MVRRNIRRAVFVLGLLEIIGTLALPGIAPDRAWTADLRTLPAEIDVGLIAIFAMALALNARSAFAETKVRADRQDLRRYAGQGNSVFGVPAMWRQATRGAARADLSAGERGDRPRGRPIEDRERADPSDARIGPGR